jgi:hypothetical protein
VHRQRHSGKTFIKNSDFLPRVLGTRHSGKRIFLKILARVLHLGKKFQKKEILPRVLHSGKSKKPGDGVDRVKSSSRARLALGKGFPECMRKLALGEGASS